MEPVWYDPTHYRSSLPANLVCIVSIYIYLYIYIICIMYIYIYNIYIIYIYIYILSPANIVSLRHSIASLAWQVPCGSICVLSLCSDLQSHIKFTVYTLPVKSRVSHFFSTQFPAFFALVKFIFYAKKSNPRFCLNKSFCPFSEASFSFIKKNIGLN